MSDAWVRLEFLKAWSADRLRGSAGTLEQYQEQFPGHDEAIAEEFSRASSRDLLATDGDPTERLAHYRLIRPLGRGGQATVYLAEDERSHAVVSIKVIEFAHARSEAHADATLRLLREASLAARLDDPGICPILDTGTEGGKVFIVMAFIPGDSLAQVLSQAVSGRRSKMSHNALLAMCESVAQSLHVAHERGVVHRDIKPANIVLTPDWRPVILDFGLARDLASDRDNLTLTGTGPVGTPAYMSPQQVRGEPTAVDRRTDIWALGVLLYECLTLTLPFSATDANGLQNAILHDDPDLYHPALPEPVRPVIACALQKDHTRRYLTALRMAEDLRRVRRGEPTVAQMPGLAYRVRSFVRRHQTLSASLGLLLLMLGAGVIWSQATVHREHALRREAEAGFTELRGLLQQLIFEIDAPLQELAGAARVRRQLLGRALDYLETLERRADPGGDLLAELATAHLKLGDAYGRPGGASLGETSRAREMYRRALRLARRAAKLGAERGRSEELVARTRLLDLDLAQGNTAYGKDECAALLRASETLLAASATPEVALARCAVLRIAGDLAAATGDMTAAAAHCRDRLALARRVHADHPDQRQVHLEVGHALAALGRHATAAGDDAAACSWFEQADAVLTVILQRDDTAVDVLDARAALALPWARSLFARDRRATATDTIDRTVTQLERDCARLDSTALARRLCLTCADGLRVLTDAQDVQGVRALLARAPAAARRLAARSGGHVRDQELVMVTLFKVIWCHVERGGERDAAVVFAQADEQMRAYLGIDAPIADHQPTRLEHLLLDAWLASRAGEADRAGRLLDEARRRAADARAVLPAWSGDLLLVAGQVELTRGRIPELREATRVAEAWLAQHGAAVPMAHRRWMQRTLTRLRAAAR